MGGADLLPSHRRRLDDSPRRGVEHERALAGGAAVEVSLFDRKLLDAFGNLEGRAVAPW